MPKRKTEKARLGRPPLPPGEARSIIIKARVTAAQATDIEERAQRDRCDVSEVVRAALSAYLVAR